MRTLEAHGTGTALGDPIEVLARERELLACLCDQVGASIEVLCNKTRQSVRCASLKSNLGHLEAAAAAAGVASLVLVPLKLRLVSANAQLIR